MIKFCFSYIWNYKKYFIKYLLLFLLSGMISAYTPLVTGNIINGALYNTGSKQFIGYCFILFILQVMANIIICQQKKYYAQLQIKTVGDICSNVIKHLQKVSSMLLNGRDFAASAQKLNNDAVQVIGFALGNIGNTILNIIILIVVLIILLNISFVLTMLIIFNGVIYILIYAMKKEKIYSTQFENKEAQSEYFSKIYEQFKYFKFIKQHSLKNFFANRLKNSLNGLYDKTLKVVELQNMISFSLNMVDITIQVICYLYMGYQIMHGELMVGAFVIVNSYMTMIKNAIIYFGGLGQNFQQQNVSYLRILEFIELPEEKVGEVVLDKIESIKVRNLSFCIKNQCILKNINGVFEKGKVYGIKGENGAGKSTFMDLLLGLYVNDYQGQILINNIEMKDINVNILRKKYMGFLEQDPVILNANLIGNLMFDEKYDNELIMKYISMYNLEYLVNDIEQLEKCDYNKLCGLSGGEKQKIGIIRQLLKDADIMMFDEPTAALDSDSCQVFKDMLGKIKQDKIIFVISHEEDILDVCDYVLYLERRL